jgi:predicted methyltransferase
MLAKRPEHARRAPSALFLLLPAVLVLAAPISSEALAADQDATASRPTARAAPARASERSIAPGHLIRAVSDPGRPDTDRRRDVNRRPAKVLAFFGIEPGMKVAEMMAGAGYYTEILSKALGPEGRVYAHNTPFVLDLYAEKPISERLARIGAGNVTRLNTDIDAPGLPEALDAVLLIRFYHDFYWMGGDRAAFNRAVFSALKPGGLFGVVDHHAEVGSGDRDAKEREGLHRIDAELVKKEILASGFVLEAESDILQHPKDTRDWRIFVEEGTKRDLTDRFIYRFRKPAE